MKIVISQQTPTGNKSIDIELTNAEQLKQVSIGLSESLKLISTTAIDFSFSI